MDQSWFNVELIETNLANHRCLLIYIMMALNGNPLSAISCHIMVCEQQLERIKWFYILYEAPVRLLSVAHYKRRLTVGFLVGSNSDYF